MFREPDVWRLGDFFGCTSGGKSPPCLASLLVLSGILTFHLTLCILFSFCVPLFRYFLSGSTRLHQILLVLAAASVRPPGRQNGVSKLSRVINFLVVRLGKLSGIASGLERDSKLWERQELVKKATQFLSVSDSVWHIGRIPSCVNVNWKSPRLAHGGLDDKKDAMDKSRVHGFRLGSSAVLKGLGHL